MPRETVEFEDVECLVDSGEAILVLIDGEKHWIPQSQVDEDSEVWRKGDVGSLIITEWIAEKKGLI